MVKNLPGMQETRVRSLRREDPPEKGMVAHSSILAWRIPWTEEPRGTEGGEGRKQALGGPSPPDPGLVSASYPSLP